MIVYQPASYRTQPSQNHWPRKLPGGSPEGVSVKLAIDHQLTSSSTESTAP